MVPLDGRGGPAVQPGPAELGQALVQGVPDQVVREPDPARRGLGQQPGEQPSLDRVQQHVLPCPGHVGEYVDAGLGTEHRGLAEDGLRDRGQPGDPALQHLTHTGWH